jgi:muramoyltetrapeptide carboxypeptidase
MITSVWPRKLKPGATISIIAPSEPVERDDITEAKKYLEELGYKFKPGKHLFYKIGDYTAGTIEDRAEDFNEAFADPEVDAIMMGIGGYAADQILELIDFEKIAKNPKIFMGYSDATILQLAMYAKTGLVSFHGPNGSGLATESEYSKRNTWEVLTNSGEIKVDPESKKWEVLRPGKGKGTLVGGNLATICSILGTAYDPFPVLKDQKLILAWEEFEDHYNEIIRNLFHLRNIGILERCEGMLVGKLTRCTEEEGYVGTPELRYVLLQMARSFDFPILWDVDFGHEAPKMVFPIGAEAEIETKTQTFKFKNNLV